MTDILLSPCGEGALRVTALQPEAEQRWRTVHAIAEWIDDNPIPGVFGSVPTYDSLLVEFDPTFVTAAMLSPLIQMATDTPPAERRSPQRFTLPVVYGGDEGPDLGFVADFLGISEEDVVTLHTAEDRVVRCFGGPAASCMIDGPAFSAPVPRLADPRLEVPPNAISVAGAQGVVGPVKAPSGWRLIGLSPVQIMDMRSATLVPYRPGDVIRFRAINVADWDDYRGTYLHELAEKC